MFTYLSINKYLTIIVSQTHSKIVNLAFVILQIQLRTLQISVGQPQN